MTPQDDTYASSSETENWLRTFWYCYNLTSDFLVSVEGIPGQLNYDSITANVFIYYSSITELLFSVSKMPFATNSTKIFSQFSLHICTPSSRKSLISDSTIKCVFIECWDLIRFELGPVVSKFRFEATEPNLFVFVSKRVNLHFVYT